MNWRTTSYTHNGGNCVEVSESHQQRIHRIRDTKNRTHGYLEFHRHEWQSFLHALRNNELD
ncbi:DUF397 domain-containing protein [Spiractinospora alimapuensis]|uniref:DUF397 domain-containing protein n=1 Tax=Spiractinospora alimapuensis TaxID=2820884 RepID=UPI001F3A517F|nr:DUF397 domain-containing protein [Spiractinospora alimapuensis]QVQ52937.1 DUF397 domain-containing protein [Spiractinospora alimapuensis]